MSEDTMNDPLGLNIDLNEVDTSRPVLPKGDYVVRIPHVEVKPNKAETGRNLVVSFETTTPTESTKGNPVDAGFRLTDYYPLQASSNKPESTYWKTKLAQLQDAVLGTGLGNRPPFDPSALIGQEVIALLDIESSEEYGEQNRVKRLVHLEE